MEYAFLAFTAEVVIGYIDRRKSEMESGEKPRTLSVRREKERKREKGKRGRQSRRPRREPDLVA